MPRLLLWDIDGTLIRGGGVGSAAIYRAAATVTGREVTVQEMMMHGKTDPQIITEILLACEVADADISVLLPQVMTECERLLAAAEADLRARGDVIDGVHDTLRAFAAIPGVRQALLTGNLVGNAAVKLAAFELNDFFDFEVGAYGTDHADRRELVPIALERVERLRGERYRREEVWVIGDTPADFACAHAAGVRCLLVATGNIAHDDLCGLGADAVVADLTDVASIVQLMTS
jgi:phosphoglycolate phosphatase